jgi:molybdate transport system permease protein
VTLPLALPGILAGVALSFARALGEFGATLMVAGNIPGRTQTIPLALYGAVEAGRGGEANVYLLVTTILSFAVVAAVGLGEGRAAVGRRLARRAR